MDKEFNMTIAPDLFKAWRKMKRKGDPGKIAGILGKSRPVIDRALNYGHVKDARIVEGITKFYEERLNQEGSAGRSLLNQMDDETGI